MKEPRACAVPAFPKPPVIEYIAECPFAAVCVTPESAVELGKWVRGVYRYYESVAACSWVREQPVPEPKPAPIPQEQPEPPVGFITSLYPPSLEGAEAQPTLSDLYAIGPIVDAMTYPGMEVKVLWKRCGHVNGYYYPSARRIVLCHELRTIGAPFIRFVVAHEMAHAVIFQLNIAFTGIHEVAADEFGAINLVFTDNRDDLYEVAKYWLTRGHPEDPFDEHTGDIRRGATLFCLAEGFVQRNSACGAEWNRAISSWVRLLGLDRE